MLANVPTSRAPKPRITLTPATRAVKVDLGSTPQTSASWRLEFGGLFVEPYAIEGTSLYFDIKDNNQLAWPSAYDAVLRRDKCQVMNFWIIKDAPTAPLLTPIKDCEAAWDVPSCPEDAPPPMCQTTQTAGCGCSALKGPSCPACVGNNVILAIHNPAY